MGFRIEGDELLEHPIRQGILDLVQEEPGLPSSDLRRRLSGAAGVGSSPGHGTISHHLYKLERAGWITKRRSGRNVRYYRKGSALGDPTQLSALQRGRAHELATVLVSEGPATSAEILRRLRPSWSPSRQVLRYHLRHLERASLVTTHRIGRRLVCAATPRLANLLKSPPSGTATHEPAQETTFPLMSLSQIPRSGLSPSTNLVSPEMA